MGGGGGGGAGGSVYGIYAYSSTLTHSGVTVTGGTPGAGAAGGLPNGPGGPPGTAYEIVEEASSSSPPSAFSSEALPGAIEAATRAQLINCAFVGNTADSLGGAVFVDDGSVFINNTFVANQATGPGGAMFNHFGDPTLINCLVWDNTSPVGGWLDTASTDPVISYSLLQSSYPGPGNIGGDPSFLYPPDPGDGDWTTLADNYYGDLRLRPDSPAIDAANSDAVPLDAHDVDGDGFTLERVPIDLKGSHRFMDITAVPDTGVGERPIVDMGAHEAWFVPAVAPAVDIHVSGDDIQLYWLHHHANGGGYEIWQDADPYFVPGSDCSTDPDCTRQLVHFYTETGAAADVANHHFYTVFGVNEFDQRSGPSNRVGEFGFSLVPGD
jgi:hypothetical protein